MKKLIATRKRKVVVVLSALLLLGAGAAVAAWLINGSGEGTGRIAGALQAPTVAPVTDVSFNDGNSKCYPGGDCDAGFKITNPNPVDLVITRTDAAIPATGTTTSPACPFTNLTMNTVTGLSNRRPQRRDDQRARSQRLPPVVGRTEPVRGPGADEQGRSDLQHALVHP
jgi:hypothetical protein